MDIHTHSFKKIKAIVSEQKPESFVKDCFGKCKQTSNLLPINSHLTKKSITEKSNIYTVFQPKGTQHSARIFCKDGKDSFVDSTF